ncbi:MAG: aminotransferase [Clostridia bacterium]|nr:aminotransferase [Clostridia bacterium]
MTRLEELTAQYEAYRAQNLKLDMSRGKPSPEQLELTRDMLDTLDSHSSCVAEDGTDARNYGGLVGIPEARRLFGDLLGVPADMVIVGGNSSLNMMFDYIATAYSKGVMGHEPWSRQDAVKFLCPVPGYDRHFSITEFFGIEMINVPMTAAGPDMDLVEQVVADPAVKGMWCVPMYSNPGGVTYSDETVRRLAALSPAAPDFRLMWDNAYCVHHLTDTPDTLLNIFDECRANGNEDLVIGFASTSKITYSGAGVAVMIASAGNRADITKRLTVQTIGHDKLNMLRHVRFFGDAAGVVRHMKSHAALLRPKFDVVLNTLEQRLGGRGIATWHRPAGGYFVAVEVPGCATETIRLLGEAGVKMTEAGAPYPYHRDPDDRTIRIAPSYPSVEELQKAMELFCICAELATLKAKA